MRSFRVALLQNFSRQEAPIEWINQVEDWFARTVLAPPL